MKLSAEQIQKIDIILEILGLDFLDFKLEIKDHIASQTEDLCNERNFSFEEALPLVLKEWQPNLLLKDSWISNKRTFPKIVVDGIHKRYLIYHFITVPLLLAFLILYPMYNYILETDSINQIMLLISMSLFLLLSGLRYLIYKTKSETSYSYEFNRIYKLATLILVFDMFAYFVLNRHNIIFWKAFFLVYVPFAIYSYYKHNQFCKRFKKFIA